MSFFYPHILYLLIFPVVLLIITIVKMRLQSSKWEILILQDYKEELVTKPSLWKRWLPLGLGVLGLCFLIGALARPINGYTETPTLKKEGRNIILAIDCSRSMLTRDIPPSRLDQAKTAAYDLLDANPEDNFALIIFSGEAHLLIPLTHDHNAIRESIEQLEFGWISYGGTNLENVLKLAVQTLERDTNNSSNALVILSDGEDTVNSEYHTAEQAKKIGLAVTTVGLGTQHGDVIPNPESPDGLYQDRAGRHVISKLVEEPLKNLANETNGQYVHLGVGSSLTSLIRQVDTQLSAQEEESSQIKIPNEQYAMFAIPALICFLIGLLAGTTWKRKKFSNISMFQLLIVGLFFSSTSHGDQLPNSQKPILSNPYDSAIQELSNSWDSEKEEKIAFANGYVLSKQGKSQEAAQSFSQSILSQNPELQAAAHYNIGNTIAYRAFNMVKPEQQTSVISDTSSPSISDNHWDQQKTDKLISTLKEAIDHYNDALSLNPNLAEASRNKKLLTQYLNQIRQFQQQNQQQNKNSNQQSDQDKNKNSNQQSDQNKNKNSNQQPDQNKNKNSNQQSDQDKNKNSNQQSDQNKNKNSDQQSDQNKNKNSNQQPDQDKNKNSNQNPQSVDLNKNPELERQSSSIQSSEQDKQQLRQAAVKESQEKQERKAAAQMLLERRDQEKGLPIPQRNYTFTPDKDY